MAVVQSTPNMESRDLGLTVSEFWNHVNFLLLKGRRKKCSKYNTNDAELLFTIGYTKLFLGQKERKDKKSRLKCELYSVQMRFSYNSVNVQR